MSAAFIGLDLAKSVFQVHGVDAQGKVYPVGMFPGDLLQINRKPPPRRGVAFFVSC
jgi:hypothetical protein